MLSAPQAKPGPRRPTPAFEPLDLRLLARPLDFIAAENSMGFHAPQEAARVLGEAIDLARQGQIAAMQSRAEAAGK